MADRRVRYILEVDYEGERAILKAADDLREVDDAAKEAGEGLERSASGFSKVQASIVTLQSGLAMAEQGFAAIQQAAQFAYDTLKEGGAIVDARGDFDDLAQSIGTTADAMESEMSAAAAGLVTDANLIAQAGELMALGLGLSKDEIVQLTGLAAELDWNFKTLTDTLNTGSTRGLKELGLNISEVKARAEELEAAGRSADEAFTWAIIEAGAAKVEKVGRKSEEASGQIQQLEVMVANVQDEFARGAAEGFAASLGLIAGSAPAAGAALEAAARGAASFGAELLGVASMNLFGGSLDYFIKRGQELQEQEQAQLDALEEVRQGRADLAEMEGVYGEQVEETTKKTEQSTTAAWAYADALEEVGEEISGGKAAAWAEQIAKTSTGYEDLTAAAAEMVQQQQAAAEAAEAWAAYTGEATARGGDYFTQITQAGPAQWDFAEALYAAADGAGAGIGPLGDIGVAYGLISEKTRDAGTALAQQQAIIDSLAGAAASGQISWENYAGAVEHAIDVLNGAPLIDLGPRQMPEMEDRGFREGVQENLAQVAQELEPIPLEVQLENEAIQTAVDEARGIVEGFTSPAEAYEAVMTMDIDEVVAKVGEAKGLIEGLPTEKNVAVNVTVTGMDLIRQLQAMGVIGP